MTELEALQILRELARRYQAVEILIADCGCITVSLFVDGVKICEEDKSLPVVIGQVMERIGNERARAIPG